MNDENKCLLCEHKNYCANAYPSCYRPLYNPNNPGPCGPNPLNPYSRGVYSPYYGPMCGYSIETSYTSDDYEEGVSYAGCDISVKPAEDDESS